MYTMSTNTTNTELDIEMEECTERMELPFLPEDCIKKNMINILQSPCGTGKTTAIDSFLRSLPTETSITVITFRKSLSSYMSELLDLTDYQKVKEKFISCSNYPRIAVSIESFWRYREVDEGFKIPDVFIIDELCSLFEHITNTSTLVGRQRDYFVKCAKFIFANPSSTSILCDAYFDDDDFQIVRSINGFSTDRIRYVKNTYKSNPKKVYYYTNPKEWKEQLFSTIMNPEKNLYVFSNSKRILEGLEFEYSKLRYPDDEAGLTMYEDGDRRRILTSDSSNEDKDHYSSQPDEYWPTNRVIWSSPTMQAGVSMMKLHFHQSFGYGIGGTSSPLALLQQLARVRKLVDEEVHLLVPKDLAKVPNHVLELELDPENIKKNIDYLDTWTNSRVQALIERETIVVGDYIRSDVVNHSILNDILIRHLRNKARAKISFLSEIRRLTANDNIELVESDKLPEITGPIPNLTNINQTVINSTDHKNQRFDDGIWDGTWNFDLEDPQQPAYMKTAYSFIRSWNVLGFMGDIQDYEGLVFNPKKFAKFVTVYCNREQQKHFDDLFLVNTFKHMEKDALDGKFNSYRFDGVFHSAIAAIFHSYGLFSITKNEPIFPVLSDDITSNAVLDVIPGHFRLIEARLNYKARFVLLCKELKRSWSILIEKLGLTKILSQTVPIWVEYSYICTKALVDLRKIVDRALGFIGLERVKKPLCESRPSCEATNFGIVLPGTTTTQTNKKKKKAESRIRVKEYRVKHCRKRFMLMILKLFKNEEANEGGFYHPNYPIEDPFKLLDYENTANVTQTWKRTSEKSVDRKEAEQSRLSRNYWKEKSTTLDNVLDRIEFWNPTDAKRMEKCFNHGQLPAIFWDPKEPRRKAMLARKASGKRRDGDFRDMEEWKSGKRTKYDEPEVMELEPDPMEEDLQNTEEEGEEESPGVGEGNTNYIDDNDYVFPNSPATDDEAIDLDLDDYDD